MKFQYFKKLAVGLALSMAVTALPATPLQAVSTPAFKTYRTSLYENGTSKGVYTYTVKNIKKGYTVRWSLSGAGLDFASLSKVSTKATGTTVSNKITVSSEGSTKAKNSKVTIVAKVYDTKGKLVNTIKDAVTLKIQATGVSIKTTKITEGVTALAVGGSYDFDRTIKPSNSTSKTYWSVTDSTGADVSSEINSSGVWTPTKAGTYTVTAITRNAKTSKELCRDTVTCVVGTTLKSVKQTAVNEFQAVFNSDVSKAVTKDSFTIKEGNGLASVFVKGVAFSADGKTVTVTTSTNFKDATSYTVTYGATDKTFTASAGEVVRIAILTSSVPVNTATTIEYALYDANDIDVKAIATGSLNYTANVTNGYLTDDNKLFLTTVGKGGTVTLTYTEGSKKFSDTKTVTCVASEASEITQADFTVTSSSATPDFTASDYKANTSVSIGDTAYAHFRAVDNKGATVSYTKVTYASSDDNVLAVEASGKLTPIKEGVATVIVSTFEGTTETTYAYKVTIQAKRKLSTLGFSATALTMSNYVDANYKKYITVTPYDQYGKQITGSYSVTATEANGRAFATYQSSTGQLVFSVPAGTAAGTYTVKASVLYDGVTVSQDILLTVVDVPNTSTTGYSLEVSTGSTKVDASIKSGDSLDDKKVTIRLARLQGGVFAGYTTFESALILKDGVYFTSGDLTGGTQSSEVAISGGLELSLTLASVSGDALKKAATGTYTIIVKLGSSQYSTGLTVTDSQNAPTVSVVSTTSSATVNTPLALAQNCLSVSDGYTITNCTAVSTTATATISSGSKIHISDVTVEGEITVKSGGADKKVKVSYTVSVGQTLTNK